MTHYPKVLKVAFPQKELQELPLDEFQKHFGFRYLPQLEFIDYRMEQWVKKRCHHAVRRGKIAEYSLWLGQLHKRELAESILPDISIRFVSEQMGYGLFTNQPLYTGQCIGEYTGVVRKRNLFFSNTNDYCFMYPREWLNLKPITIDGAKAGNHTRFINHSDKPNLEALAVFFEGCFHILFRTLCPILPGAELTYDYGEFYWRSRKKLSCQPQVQPEKSIT